MSHVCDIYADLVRVHTAIEPFLHAKWQELFSLFMTDSSETLKLICGRKARWIG